MATINIVSRLDKSYNADSDQETDIKMLERSLAK